MGLVPAPAQAKLLRRLDWKVEKYLGKATQADMAATEGFSQNLTLTENIRRIGRGIAGQSQRRDTVEVFHLVDSPDINAFAAPGGYVFVTRGLVARLNNEDELAGVMAHEWGHVEAKHGLKTLKKWPLAMALGLAAGKHFGGRGAKIADTALSLATLHDSRENEYQADELGVKSALALGYDPGRFADFFMKLEADHPMGKMHRLEVAFMSHPRTLNRFSAVERHVKATHTDLDKWAGVAGSLLRRGQVTAADALLQQMPQVVAVHPELTRQLALSSGWGWEAAAAPSPAVVLEQTAGLSGPDKKLFDQTALALVQEENESPGEGLEKLDAFLITSEDTLAALPGEAPPHWLPGLVDIRDNLAAAAEAGQGLDAARAGARQALGRVRLMSETTLTDSLAQVVQGVVKSLRETVNSEGARRLSLAPRRLNRLAENLLLNTPVPQVAPEAPAWTPPEEQAWVMQAQQEKESARVEAQKVRRETEKLLGVVLDKLVEDMGPLERKQLPRVLAHRLLMKESQVRDLLRTPWLKVSDVAWVAEARRRKVLKPSALPQKKELNAARVFLSDMDVLLGWLVQDLENLSREELGVLPRWPTTGGERERQKALSALAELLAGEGKKANTLYGELLENKNFQPDAEVFIQAAQAAALAGKMDDARLRLHKALGLMPENTRALNLLGLYAPSAKIRANLWRESLEINPHQPVVASRLAALLTRRKSAPRRVSVKSGRVSKTARSMTEPAR